MEAPGGTRPDKARATAHGQGLACDHFLMILRVETGPDLRSLLQTTPFRAGKERGRLWNQTCLPES